jgi:hypothetical protein
MRNKNRSKSLSPKKQRNSSPKKKIDLKERERGFNLSGNEHIAIPEYNSLFDKNLQGKLIVVSLFLLNKGYYSQHNVRKVLQKSCLVRKLQNLIFELGR